MQWSRAISSVARVAVAIAVALSADSSAQSVRALQEQTLRADRTATSNGIGALTEGQEAELLQMAAGWAQVRFNGQAGWVRASALQMPAASVGDAARLETGRRATGNSAVALGVRALPPRNNRHALIVGISRWAQDPSRPVDPLLGVPHDVASAMRMAEMFQVPRDNIVLLRDEAATRDGVARAVAELQSRVQPGDRVFIYWSGHGSRYFDESVHGCLETLVPYDLKDISHRQFASWVKAIGTRADKVLVLYDACHSGGSRVANERLSRAYSGSLKPKFLPGPDVCQKPSNLRDRGLSAALSDAGVPAGDVVHIASAAPDQVSFDNAATGGLATSALLSCMSSSTTSGGEMSQQSVAEITRCAQADVNKALRPYPNLLPPTITLSGNRAFVPAWLAMPSAPPVLAALPAQPALPPHVPEPPANVEWPNATQLAQQPPNRLAIALAQVHAQRDTKWRVVAKPSQDSLRIGQDAIGLSITSSRSGYVYVAMLGSDGQSLYLLFPNDLDQANRIEAGASILLPRPAWRVVAQGPVGRDDLLVLVSDGPRDLSALGGGKAGPFSKPLTDASGLTQFQWLIQLNAATTSASCRNARRASDGCSDGFGSTIVSIKER